MSSAAGPGFGLLSINSESFTNITKMFMIYDVKDVCFGLQCRRKLSRRNTHTPKKVLYAAETLRTKVEEIRWKTNERRIFKHDIVCEIVVERPKLMGNLV